jgi:SAM-dependent methyltransferase
MILRLRLNEMDLQRGEQILALLQRQSNQPGRIFGHGRAAADLGRANDPIRTNQLQHHPPLHPQLPTTTTGRSHSTPHVLDGLFGPNTGQPVDVEIGRATKTFWPVSAEATYELEFNLERAERTIQIHPPYPTSPASLGDSIHDSRRIGLGFVRLEITKEERLSREPTPYKPALGLSSRSEKQFWETLYTTEDPWHYSGSYEQEKYLRTLELAPKGQVGLALEIGCAEGLFTEMLAPRVEQLIGVDISDTALARARDRCARFPHVSFACVDIAETFPQGSFDLIICSEVLYYVQDVVALRQIVGEIRAALSIGGFFLMANANSVSDDRTTSGFDFAEVGSAFIGETFAEAPMLEFLKELRTPLYRIQLFRRRDTPSICAQDLPEFARVPQGLVECSASFVHPLIRWGGCAITLAEAKYFYDTIQVPILMYHRIASSGPDGLARYRLEPPMFERQLAYLQRYGYRGYHTICPKLHAKDGFE